jgi:hypothetical protein
MIKNLVFLLVLVLIRETVAGYSSAGDEPCTKATFKAKFGAEPTYEIDLSENEPRVIDGEIRMTVKYETICSNGGSDFTPIVKSGMEKMDAIILSRSEPECSHKEKLDHTIVYTEDIQIPLPKFKPVTAPRNLFLAFPPDSLYEIYMLQKSGERVYTIEEEETEDAKQLDTNTTAANAELSDINGDVTTINAAVTAES